MTKSKKQYAKQSQDQQSQGMQSQGMQSQGMKSKGTGDEFGRTIELTFAEHPWPASRGDLIEHAGRQGTFAKSDMARLKQIPHREYHSIADLMDATRKVEVTVGQGPGPVTTADHNRRAMGNASTDVPLRSHAQYDEQTH
jgi:hypothetical protein